MAEERIVEFQVPRDAVPGRADKLFASAFDDLSRARLQKAFEAGEVTFDGRVVDKRFTIRGPGCLRAVLQAPAAEAESPRAVALPLHVVYEDASLLVVDKASGMTIHPGNGTEEDTLVHALLHHCGDSLSNVGGPERPGIVHRLDKETSGLIVVAKEDRAHHRLAEAFSGRNVFKRYRALVAGAPDKRSGSCVAPVGRHPVVRTRMAVRPSGRPAHTDWEVEARYGNRAARLGCVLHTGRTHQIRVHLSDMRHPLLGDATYGFRASMLPGIEVPRVMLHSAELAFAHPESGARMSFEAPLPADFRDLGERLEGLAGSA